MTRSILPALALLAYLHRDRLACWCYDAAGCVDAARAWGRRAVDWCYLPHTAP